MKNLENEATLELLEVKEAEDLSIERDRIKKKKKKEEKEIEEKLVKRKQ